MTEKVTQSKIKYTTLYPTSLIINGLDLFGYELAKSLSDQGGYVIIVDDLDKEATLPQFSKLKNVAFLDYVGISDMVEEIRRLDYVFYLNHNNFDNDTEFSSQDFLATSSYLNQILNLTVDFEALFLLTSSIRAHKYLLSVDRYTDKFVQDSANDISYSEAEFARYAESLTMEYKKTRNLAVKIIRMGELLGEGIELSKSTYVGQMIWQAINKEDLILQRDGLDSEYYVHLIDAVYGVLKAQFTKNADDLIYTLAYREPLTQLSLAYKIQEFEMDAGDIKFQAEDESKVRLHIPIYKAAKNLSTIGWQPKVDMDSALIQSIAFAKDLKEHLLNKEVGRNAKDKNGGDSKDSQDEKIELPPSIRNTALAKLIAERKQNEANSKQKYKQGAHLLEQRQKDVPWITKFRRSLIRRYDRFKRNFQFLQEITVAELGLYSVLVGLFIFIFLALLSPLMSMVRDFVILDSEMKTIKTASDKGDWQKFQETSLEARARVRSLDETISNADILFTLTGRTRLQQELLGLSQSMDFYVESLINVSESVDGLETKLGNDQSRLVYRPTNASVLSLGDENNVNAQNINIGELKSKNDIAKRSLDSSRRIYDKLDKRVLPGFLTELTDDLFKESDNLEKMIAANNRTLTFIDKQQFDDYVVGMVVQDNVRTNYNGGQIAAIGILEYQKGKLSAVKLLPVQNANFKVSNLTEDELNHIRKVSGRTILGEDGDDANKVLQYAINKEDYNGILQSALNNAFQKEVSTVISINLNGFSDLLYHYGEVEVNDKPINGANMLAQINLLQEKSDNSRNTIIANLSGVLLTKLFDFNNEGIAKKQSIISTLYKGNNITIDPTLTSDLGLTAPARGMFIGGLASQVDNYNSNPQIDVNIKSQLTVSKFTHNVTINTSNAKDITNLAFCTIEKAESFDLTKLSIEAYTEVNMGDRDCIIFDTTNKKEYTFSYITRVQGKNIDNTVAIAPGLGLRYDVEINYPGSYALSQSVPPANKRNNTVFYSGETYNNFNYKLTFN